MSQAIGHFAVGYGLTTGILLATGLHKKIENTEPIKVVGGGIWAMLPDAGKLVPYFERFHDYWWTDIFWFHRLLDTKIDPTDSPWISFWLIVFMLVTLGIFWLVDKKKAGAK